MPSPLETSELGRFTGSFTLFVRFDNNFRIGCRNGQDTLSKGATLVTSARHYNVLSWRCMMQRVPVLHRDRTPLMPCKPAKARKLIRDGKAIKRWTREGVFYIQLTFETSKDTQPMCLGIDPGSKYDGYAVLTDQEIVTSAMAILPDIRKKVELRRILRRGRRYRKNRRRKARQKDMFVRCAHISFY